MLLFLFSQETYRETTWAAGSPGRSWDGQVASSIGWSSPSVGHQAWQPDTDPALEFEAPSVNPTTW